MLTAKALGTRINYELALVFVIIALLKSAIKKKDLEYISQKSLANVYFLL